LCHSRVGLNNLAKEFCYIPAGKRELPRSSNNPDAKRVRFTGTVVSNNCSCMGC